MGFVSVLAYAQRLVKERVQPGDRVVDATIGGGNDCVFLAETVGKKGIVYGFDIQQAAVQQTTDRFISCGRSMDNVRLICDSHARMRDLIPPQEHGRIAAVMFNLGYLPGADESAITQTESTLEALNAALSILRTRGIITAVLYPGHEGGDTEASAVADWARELPQTACQVLAYRFVNGNPRAPYLLAIEKR